MFLGNDLDNDSGSELDNDWIIKNPLPSARRTPPPRAPLIPDPFGIIDCTPTPSCTPGLSTPPFPNYPGHGPPLRTEYDTASRRSRAYCFRILQRAAGVSLHSGTPLPTLIPKGLREGYLYASPLHVSGGECLSTPVKNKRTTEGRGGGDHSTHAPACRHSYVCGH